MSYNKKRQERVRWLIKSHNKIRKKHTKQIDILCHDLIDAHRSFISRLGAISFAAGFYKSLVGVTDLDKLLGIAAGHIRTMVPKAQVSFYLMQSDSCREVLYSASTVDQNDQSESRLNDKFALAICAVNKVCELEQLQSMDLYTDADLFNNFSVGTIPLSVDSQSIGFILLCTRVSNPLQSKHLKQLYNCSGSLAQAVVSTEMYCRSL